MQRASPRTTAMQPKSRPQKPETNRNLPRLRKLPKLPLKPSLKSRKSSQLKKKPRELLQQAMKHR